MAQPDEIIRRCEILNCDTIVVVPSMDLKVDATKPEIRKDAVEVLKEKLKKKSGVFFIKKRSSQKTEIIH